MTARRRRPLDLHECDPERFDDHGLSRPYARARGAQQYREVYDVIHPAPAVRAARAACGATPFYQREIGLGAVFFESAGWERPQWYEANAALSATTAAAGRARPGPRSYWSPIVAAEHLRLPRSASASSTSRRSPRRG